MPSFGLESYAQLEQISVSSPVISSNDFLWSFQILFYLTFGAGMLGDLLVAVILCHYLWVSRTGFRR